MEKNSRGPNEIKKNKQDAQKGRPPHFAEASTFYGGQVVGQGKARVFQHPGREREMNIKDMSTKRFLAFWLTVFVGIAQLAFAAESPSPAPPSGVTQKGRTVVLDDIVFGFNEPSPKPESTEILEWLVLYLVRHPDKKVIISGHTDVSGPDAYNTYLSKQRAHAVSKVLTDGGIERERILLRWFGEKQPLGDNANLSSRVKSRRVEIEIQ